MSNSSSKISHNAHKYSTHETATNVFKLFLYGYFRQIPAPHIIATDIIDLIIKYYTFNQFNPRLCFISFHIHSNNGYILQCSTNTTSKLHGNDAKHRLHDNDAAKVSIEYETLPYSVTQKFKKEQIRYSMYATVGGIKQFFNGKWTEYSKTKICQLVSFEFESNSQDQNATVSVFDLPSFPFPIYKSSLVYSPIYHTLFAINGRSSDDIEKQWIYSFDFASRNKNFKWELVTNRLLCKSYTSIACMVDNRFIAIFVPDNDAHVVGELFALNCNQSIKISQSNIIFKYEDSACIYISKKHQVIVGDTLSANLYDINKDYWFTPSTWNRFGWYRHFGDCDTGLKLRISSLDPNIMFAEASDGRNSVVVKSFDLRTYEAVSEYYAKFDIYNPYNYKNNYLITSILV